MPRKCVVFSCENIGVHYFPKDEMCKRWLAAIRNPNLRRCGGDRSSVVCSEHFLESDYRTEEGLSGLPLTRRRLKKGSVPSVFPWKRNLTLRELLDGRLEVIVEEPADVISNVGPHEDDRMLFTSDSHQLNASDQVNDKVTADSNVVVDSLNNPAGVSMVLDVGTGTVSDLDGVKSVRCDSLDDTRGQLSDNIAVDTDVLIERINNPACVVIDVETETISELDTVRPSSGNSYIHDDTVGQSSENVAAASDVLNESVEVNHPTCVAPVMDVESEPVRVKPSPQRNLKCVKKGRPKKTTRSMGTQTTFKYSCTYEVLKKKPDVVSLYTGLDSFEKFMIVLNSLGPSAYELNYRYSGIENVSVEDQFLMTLMKLRLALSDFALAVKFDVSKKTVQNIVVTWINFMYIEWSELNIWPTKDLIHYFLPDGFRKFFPTTRVMLDGTEIPIATPKNPIHQQACFSTYKNRPTEKVVVGASPGGLISYISPAYGGSTSDRAIIERSGLLQKCDPGDSIMADRGFPIQDIAAFRQVTVNIPAFVKGQPQLPGVTLLKDRKLASKRVHIERIIGLAKTYNILKRELPAHYVPLGSEIIFVCCMLCNYREGIIGRKA